MLAGEAETALRQLNELAQQGKDIARLVSELLNHFRNLLIFQVLRGDLRLIEASEAEVAALQGQANRLHSDAVTRMLEVLTDCEGRLRDSTSKKILVEVTLLKMIEARNAVSIDTVLKQVQQLRAEAAAGAPKSAAPKAAPAPAAKPAPRAAPMTAAPPPGDTDLGQLWEKLVDAVSRASPFVHAYFKEAHAVSFVKNVLTIGFDPEDAEHLPLVDNSKNHALVQTKLAELGHPNTQVRFIQHEAPLREKKAAPAPRPPASAAPAPAAAAPEAAPLSQEDFKNDPLIQKALEIFKGRIIEVRS